MVISNDQSGIINDEQSHQDDHEYRKDQVKSLISTPDKLKENKPNQAIHSSNNSSSHYLQITFDINSIHSKDYKHASCSCSSLIDGLNFVEQNNDRDQVRMSYGVTCEKNVTSRRLLDSLVSILIR